MLARQSRLAAALAAGGLAAATAAALVWWCWPSLGDPLSHLPVAAGPLAAREERAERVQGRVIRHLVLDGGRLGKARLAVSLPDPSPKGPTPVLFIMGGLRTGEDSIRHVDAPGGTALVGFGYPIDRRAGRGLKLLARLPALRAQALATPGMAAAALGWVRAQPWADPTRVTPVGVSLGAIFLPAALRLDQRAANRSGARPFEGAGRIDARRAGAKGGPAVLAYGGAGLDLLAAHWLGLPHALGALAALGLAPVDPARHLPHLAGEFLFVGGAGDDALVPRAASRRMAELAPEPKTIVRLPGGHVGGEAESTGLLAAAVRIWLGARGALAP